MDDKLYSFFPSLHSVGSISNYVHYKDYLHNLLHDVYGKVMTSFGESVIEYIKPKPVEIAPIECSDKESEIFSSNTDIDEQTCSDICPLLQGIDILGEVKPPNEWWGLFSGFTIFGKELGFDIAENRKCVEISLFDNDLDIEMYLRKGVRCFIIDLFLGTDLENLKLIYKLKEAEIRLSREYNYSIISTLIAKLPPRHQYTGYTNPPNSVYQMELKDTLVLSVDRYWSTRGSNKIMYVNARNLIENVKVCDVLAVGHNLQVTVRAVDDTNIFTVVSRVGELRSRSCVLFPHQCERYRISWEEVESIAFASAAGISVISSFIDGTPSYLENLRKVLLLMEAGHMRLFARLVVNEIKGCSYEKEWVANCYDGFIIDFKISHDNKPQLLKLCPNAACLIEDIYRKGKPILLENFQLIRRKLLLPEQYYMQIFLYPDKYIVRSDCPHEGFYFNFLLKENMRRYNLVELSRQPFCDTSYTGIDTLTRATVAASFEIPAKAIVVTSQYGLIARKLAKFRPDCPIIIVSRTKELIEYVMIYFNVNLLFIPTSEKDKYKHLVFKDLLYGIGFLAKMRLIQDNDYLMLIYSMRRGLKFQDKYVKFQYNAPTFQKDLKSTLYD